MTAPPRIFTRLLGTKADGTASAVKVAPRVISGVSRSLGINGAERIGLIVPRAVETPATGFADVWPPADWDLARPMTLEFGLVDDADDETNKVVIGGLRLLQQDPTSFGVPADADNIHNTAITSTAQEMELVLAPITALWGDGRGGLIRSKVWNPLRADGTVDTADTATYRTNSQLIFEAAAATGLTATLTSPQQTDLDSFPPPAPLDWSNREAPPELDALCARLGYAPVLGLSGETLRFVRLPKAGESITPPSWVTDNAEPYELSQAISLRGQTIVVHSGDTRSIAVTTLDLTQLEWVWFDERTGRWLNDAETATLYSGEVQPGSITELRAPNKDKRQQQTARLFRAVRIADAELRAKLARMVPFPGVSGGSTPAGKVAAVVDAVHCVAEGPQFVARAQERLVGAQVVQGQGVIVLPRGVVYATIPSKAQGAHADLYALDHDGTKTRLKVTVAYEVNTGVFNEQTYWQAFKATASAGVVTVAAITDATERTAALESPDSIKIRAEFLQRVGTGTVAQVFTWSNTSDLDAIALKIATSRAGGTDLSPGGTIELRGWHDRLPGQDWVWCSRIEWYLAQGQLVTRLTIGAHQTSGSGFDLEEASARRSVAAGLGRFSSPGGAAATSDVRSGGAPGDGAPASLSSPGTLGADSRGAEARVPASPVAASANTDALADIAVGTWLAKITGSTSAGTNKWTYNWTEVALADNGSVAAPATSGRTQATTGYGVARNLAEANNAASGVQGNGVDVADLSGTLAIRPIPTGRIVQMSGPFGTSGAPFCVFTAENGLQGACA